MPLATRPDWAELLTAAAQLGTTTVWVAVLARALAHGGQVWGADTLWFDLRPLPEVSGLAARHGNPRGRAVHFTGASARYLWLDRAQHAVRA